jgi:hypothetical protein
MKLIFKWIDPHNLNVLEPYCYVDDGFENERGFNALTSLLTDHGGRGYLSLISWPDEGLKRIAAIRKSEISISDWCSDSWGAKLTSNEVKVYSLYDETYFDLMNLNSFENVLNAWKNFIQSESRIDKFCEIEV